MEAARASLQGEVNTARQRIQAAEKARLELEVRHLTICSQGYTIHILSPKRFDSMLLRMLLGEPLSLAEDHKLQVQPPFDCMHFSLTCCPSIQHWICAPLSADSAVPLFLCVGDRCFFLLQSTASGRCRIC